MARILHIMRAAENQAALTLAREQSAAHEVTLLLLHEAVGHRPDFPGRVCRARDDCLRRGLAVGDDALAPDQIVALIAGHDRVITW